MLNKLKDSTTMSVVVRYISSTPFWRKLLDVLLIAVLMIAWGMATGKVPLPPLIYKTHTVRESYNKSQQIQKILDVAQYNKQYSFVGHFIFHNGQSSLNGSFNFIKFSLMEHSSLPYIAVNPLEWKDVPFQVDLKMVSTLLDGHCYAKMIGFDDVTVIQYRKLNVDVIVACPIFDRKKQLASFIVVGTSTGKTIDPVDVQAITQEVAVPRK